MVSAGQAHQHCEVQLAISVYSLLYQMHIKHKDCVRGALVVPERTIEGFSVLPKRFGRAYRAVRGFGFLWIECHLLATFSIPSAVGIAGTGLAAVRSCGLS